MLETVSPYALLCASKPKPASIPTAYDLYSVAQSSAPGARVPDGQASSGMQPAPIAPDAAPAVQASEAAPGRLPPRIPVRRTHYISDIKSRHSAAEKHTTFSSGPVPTKSSVNPEP